LKSTTLLAVAMSAVLALPALASAEGRRGGEREARGGGDVSSRVASRIRRAERALDRAEERVDDGENAKAIAQLKANRRYLASAVKAAPGSRSVARAQHHTITSVVGLFDGVTDADLVSALDATLDAAVAGRSTGDADDLADEVEAIDGALANDELTDAGKASLNDAKAAISATTTNAADGADYPGGGSGGDRDGHCRDRGGDDGANYPGSGSGSSDTTEL
jgi:hypothetical protein